MNRLKHIRGINVSRHIPSNAGLPSHYGQHTDIYFKNRQFKSQVQGSDRLYVANKNYNVDIKYSKQFRSDDLRFISKGNKTICKQRSRTKSSVTSLKKKLSMDKKLPLENIVRTMCHYSTCQNVKFNSSGFNKRHKSQIVAIINDAKNVNHHSSFVASIEKYPRSYAEMIADYSEALYKVSTVGVRNDSLYFDNTILKSPLSTFSTPPSVKKIANVTEYNGVPIEGQKNYSSLPAEAIKSFDRCVQRDNKNTNAKTINKVTNQDRIIANDSKNDDHSYAKLVADCSKSMHNISLANISNGGLVLSRNVLARKSLQSFVTPRKANSTNTQETLRKTSLTVATIPLEKNVKEQLIVPKKHNWLNEIESVTRDLRSVIERRTARTVNISKLKESDIPRFVDTSDNSLHKVHKLTKLIKAHKQKEKDTAIRKLDHRSDKTDKMKKCNNDFALRKHNYYSQLSDKTSDLPQHFSNVTSSSARKSSTHVQTSGTTSVLKQPQVKLRMVPSEKESVVSINVDSVSNGLFDSSNPASKQLSVVVQSDRKEDPQSTENQWNVSTRRGAKSAPQRNDFGPMRISISEDSAPVKQIEFSINGKPVSELKSITARTERLDVVSSMDKIEIRIPFAKDDANAPSKIGETDLSKETDSSTGQILNVQISANFQDQSIKGSAEKPRETKRYQYDDKDTTPESSSPISKSYYSFNESGRAREDTFSSDNMQQYGFSDRIDVKSDNMAEKNINEHKASGDVELNIQRKTAKNLSTDETMTDVSLIEERNKPEIKNLNAKKVMNTIRSLTNKYDKNESSGHRVPSKTIPWWSSSDSFNKIKKKEEHPKPLLTKKIQSINDATITINKSSDLTSHSKSVEQYVESKPIPYYSFRLKPNKENSYMKSDLKIKDNQMSAVQEDKNIFGIIQTKPIALSTSGATNISEHDVREKASVLQKKTLNSAQDLSLKRNREKTDNYSLKQTKSIDDVLGTKSKIENIPDALKMIEKSKGTSREPTVKINSRVGEIQSPPAGTIKVSVPNTSVTEIREQIAKTVPIKQTKLDEAKKLEIRMNILKEKENLLVKNVATSDVKLENKNDIKNIQQIYQNDVMTTNTSNSKDPLKSTQTLRKQKKLTEDTIVFQDNLNEKKKSLLEYGKDKPGSSSSIKITSGTIKSEKLGMSIKMPSEETKQNRPKNLSNIKNTSETIQEIEKSRNPTIPTLESNSPQESSDKKMINQKKSPLEIINEIQTKYNINTNKIANIDKQSQTKSNSKLIISKLEDRAANKNLMEKNARKTPDKFVKKMDKKDDAENKIARIVTQNPKSNDSLSKSCEKNHLDKSKSGKDKRNLSEAAGSLLRKPNGSIGFKSADSKTKSIVMSNDNCTYERKSILMEPLYPNYNRRDDTISNSQSAMFKVPRNLHNNMLEHRAPRIIGSAGSWINVDRPEKSMLYSAWLQRSRSDINKNEKLF
ncbi:uncharacterized protein PF3D7_1120000 [Polyergus mexicanus]|uniref:uncharacterized protein PF3D7_1120000 n=1 Tax=Polyergus mexicanus TaxID=615972 RepID=UPI0038B457D7